MPATILYRVSYRAKRPSAGAPKVLVYVGQPPEDATPDEAERALGVRMVDLETVQAWMDKAFGPGCMAITVNVTRADDEQDVLVVVGVESPKTGDLVWAGMLNLDETPTPMTDYSRIPEADPNW